ncbi:3'-5' exoribonuclease [Halalkalibacterium halodurans]|uniref:3'-5' exonuclease n=1 Tax=Halalkalibacterium halodurans TaxID=86665 RepID=UPI002E1C84FD|nr:3'-5' exoribonuclease [Halalkalibacterium halodurans]
MKRIDVMVDIETLGHKTDSTVFQIAAVAFNIKTGEHIATFNRIADIAKDRELKVTGSTIKWWLNTDKELITKLLNSGEGSSDNIIHEFHRWLHSLCDSNYVLLWGNGILFDNKIIQHHFERLGLDYPIYYKNDRDVRTLLEIASMKLGITARELKDRFKDERLTAHNAFDDVTFQINLVSWCYNYVLGEDE